MARKTLLLSFTLLLLTFTLYGISLNQVHAKGQVCPLMLKKLLGSSENCERVKCKSNLKAEDCSGETVFQENIDSCGCCPGCVRVKEVGANEECGKDTASYVECGEKICPIEIRECEKGLMCNAESNTCTPIEDDSLPICTRKLAVAKKEGWTHWLPTCNPDGSYAPRQCKGNKGKYDSACFCTTPTGDRILGRRQWTDKAEEEMDCACSLHVHELRAKGLLTTLHCNYYGSYDRLQCDGDTGLCYCVDTKTGEMNGAVLPEGQWKDLPCYTSDMGGTYLRQCESYWLAAGRIKLEASIHGLTLESYDELDCDYDGSYKRVAKAGNIEKCVHKNGDTIGSYFRQGGIKGDMDCNCARLSTDYEAEGLSLRGTVLTCSGAGASVGNFELVQTVGTQAVCVDRDGYIYYEAPSTNLCCLEQDDQGYTTCTASFQEACFEPNTNPTGYRQCHKVES